MSSGQHGQGVENQGQSFVYDLETDIAIANGARSSQYITHSQKSFHNRLNSSLFPRPNLFILYLLLLFLHSWNVRFNGTLVTKR